ncbi:MAG TPA: aminomethyl-transferring glycine dehydrogenase subunit GcvPA, partial [Candidatus Obscuribacterales bacterium]
ICLITGMEVANASMYDGPTACAEAALMACRLKGRETVVMSEAVNPEYRMVTRTYLESAGLRYVEVAAKSGATDAFKMDFGQEAACFIAQYPNYFGTLENLNELCRKTHEKGALLVVVSEPISLGLLTPPGEFGADIVIGDAQPCGNSLSFGGPSAGYMACRKDYIRQLPGRLAGITQDNRGQRAFTLTLQTREQHIRRAKATSNICTNQALNALTMLVYLTSVGPEGLREIANISVQRAHYLCDHLSQIAAVNLPFANQPFFNEFVYETELPAEVLLQELKKEGILGGVDLAKAYPHLANCVLVAVTEMNSVEELDRYAQALKSILSNKSAGQSGKSANEKAEPVASAAQPQRRH